MSEPRMAWIAKDPASKAVVELARKVAETSTTLLITGESGTGKDHLARLIHELGPRRDAPFLKIDCASLPEELVESELFGHERGAFTGAVERKPGRLEMAGRIVLGELEDRGLLRDLPQIAGRVRGDRMAGAGVVVGLAEDREERLGENGAKREKKDRDDKLHPLGRHGQRAKLVTKPGVWDDVGDDSDAARGFAPAVYCRFSLRRCQIVRRLSRFAPSWERGNCVLWGAQAASL